MADYSCKSDDVVKCKNVYPVLMKELQNAWNCSDEMDLNSRRTEEVKRMCLNGIICRGTHQVKNVTEMLSSYSIFCLTN